MILILNFVTIIIMIYSLYRYIKIMVLQRQFKNNDIRILNIPFCKGLEISTVKKVFPDEEFEKIMNFKLHSNKIEVILLLCAWNLILATITLLKILL